MAYAAWTKGSAALLIAIRALAVREGVDEALLSEWDRSAGELRRISMAGRFTAPKAWRVVAETNEIAQTFTRAGLPANWAPASRVSRIRGSDLRAHGRLQRLRNARSTRRDHRLHPGSPVAATFYLAASTHETPAVSGHPNRSTEPRSP